MSWLLPKRQTEATAQQLVASGAWGGGGVDPVDGDVGFRQMGGSGRPLPGWNLERMRAFSVAAYRSQPMARAVVDTYVAFCVGDTGITVNARNADVRAVVEAFTNDPRVMLADQQEVGLRSHLLNGETVREVMVGELSGATRMAPIDPARIRAVHLDGNNALWPAALEFVMPMAAEPATLRVVAADDLTGLRTGECFYWASFQTLDTDVRGEPFLGPVLDWLDNYDQVLSNLVDRTALARYLAYTVKLTGGDPDDFIRTRGGNHLPKSGTIEVHNESVEWQPLNAQAGAYEDTTTSKAVLTSVAGGAGLSKVWLAEPEDANRATSLTMAEPVRRRIGSVQNVWLRRQTELVRFVVDQAVLHGRLPAMVPVEGSDELVPAAQCVSVTGPQVAAADAKVTATVMRELAIAITAMRSAGVLSEAAAHELTKKGWQDFMGVPWRAELDAMANDGDVDNLADAVDASPDSATALLTQLMTA